MSLFQNYAQALRVSSGERGFPLAVERLLAFAVTTEHEEASGLVTPYVHLATDPEMLAKAASSVGSISYRACRNPNLPDAARRAAINTPSTRKELLRNPSLTAEELELIEKRGAGPGELGKCLSLSREKALECFGSVNGAETKVFCRGRIDVPEIWAAIDVDSGTPKETGRHVKAMGRNPLFLPFHLAKFKKWVRRTNFHDIVPVLAESPAFLAAVKAKHDGQDYWLEFASGDKWAPLGASFASAAERMDEAMSKDRTDMAARILDMKSLSPDERHSLLDRVKNDDPGMLPALLPKAARLSLAANDVFAWARKNEIERTPFFVESCVGKENGVSLTRLVETGKPNLVNVAANPALNEEGVRKLTSRAIKENVGAALAVLAIGGKLTHDLPKDIGTDELRVAASLSPTVSAFRLKKLADDCVSEEARLFVGTKTVACGTASLTGKSIDARTASGSQLTL